MPRLARKPWRSWKRTNRTAISFSYTITWPGQRSERVCGARGRKRKGGGSSFIKRYMRTGQMVGVDVSKNAVDLSRAIHRLDGLEFRVGDAENLPFSGSSFDAVVNLESSHCYPSFRQISFRSPACPSAGRPLLVCGLSRST